MNGDWNIIEELDEVIEILSNMPNGFSEGEELDADIESCSPEDSSRFQAGLAVRKIVEIQRKVRDGRQ